MAENKAAWLTAKQAHPFKVDAAPMPTPPANSIVIRVRAVAINPVDYGIQAFGMILDKFPCIEGCDAAGEVTAVGSAVKEFKVGDRVIGCVDHVEPAAGQGSFQLYTTLLETLAGKIPDSVSFTDGSVLPLAMCTACQGLYDQGCLGLPYPSVEPPKETGKVLLVWGGSSSVGSCAIQAAKASGFEIAATAGGKNLEYCKSIGADYVFDHKSETIVEDIVKALKGKDFAGAFDAIIGPETYVKCAEITHQLGGTQILQTVLPAHMPYDEPLPGKVEIRYNWGSELKDTPVGPAVWHDWVPHALANGNLKCKPDAHIVGKGLEKIQDAVDRMKEGASAQKFVVEIP